MNKLIPIALDNGVTQIHPLRKTDLLRIEEITKCLFEILSDKENTKYIAEKRVESIETLSQQILGISLRYEQELGYTHFITLKANKEVLGQINIITPKGIKSESNYGIERTWFLEFFLNKKVWGFGIMSGALKAIVENMKKQGIFNIAALCKTENIASMRTLEKVGFERIGKFDLEQYLYKI